MRIIFTIVFTFFLYFLFINFPGFLPKLPESAAIFVVELFGAETQEQVADIEILYVLTLSFIIAIMAISGCFWFRQLLTSKISNARERAGRR
ncbi:hypothetical protein [Agarivorans gilvus]|uniref:hypothetical protein n=1 Tax=Agarivorans gilvus TaxID=680279 RepID=UPI0012EDDD91|nr:hypothetical protein [Agarivorans gilvus]